MKSGVAEKYIRVLQVRQLADSSKMCCRCDIGGGGTAPRISFETRPVCNGDGQPDG